MGKESAEGRSTDICFGLTRELDEQSLRFFLSRISRPQLLDTLVPRLKDDELDAIVRLFTRLMGRHLSEQEYHRLFLKDRSSPES